MESRDAGRHQPCLAGELAELLANLMVPRVAVAGQAARPRRYAAGAAWRQSGTLSVRGSATRIEVALDARVENVAAVALRVGFAPPRLNAATRALLLPRGIATVRLRGSLPVAAARDFDLWGSFAVGDWPDSAGAAARAASTHGWAIGDDLHVGDIGEVLPRALRPFLRGLDTAVALPRRAIVRGWSEDVSVALVLRERSPTPVAGVRPVWRNAEATVAR